MQQLNKRIDQLKDNYSSLLLNGNYDKHKQFKNIPLLKLKTNIRRDSFKQSNEIGSQVCFIDVKVEFPKKYPREQFTSVYLLTHSCPPTMINPNYIYISSNQLNNHDINLKNHTIPYIYSCTLTCSGIMNNDNDDDIGQNVRTPLHSNQPPLDTIVILMLYYTFSQVNSNNNISSSPLNHSTTKCIKKCIKIPLCLFTSSTIVSKDEIEGKFALTFRLLSRLNNLKDNLHLSNLFPNLWPQNYTTGLNDSSISNKQQDSTICVSFCKSKGIVERSVQCIYISIKLQKCQLKLKSNYPETFWPILQELVFYNNLITELKKGNINNNNAFLVITISTWYYARIRR
ncbi:unnamed protein product [Heterobilharzia americana]|nr:unnamed protein product [Heterobilharzia americana]